jgi:hypothetical protein
MLNRLVPLLSCAALLAAASAPVRADTAAAAAPPTALPPVTVEGQATAHMIQEQARDFAEAYDAPTAQIGQIPRWRDAVCVRVAGLPDAQNAQIKGRIEDVATALGRALLPAGCAPNIEVVFTDKPQGVVDDVAHRRQYILGYYHRHDVQRLKAVTHPIQAWYVTATVGAGGISGPVFAYMQGNMGYGIPVQPHREVIDDPDNITPAGCGDSFHFTVCMQSVLKNVLVVADTKALKGKDAGLLSDYLAMVTLSQPRSLDHCNSLPSVIDIFANAECAHDRPGGLTPDDAAYLTALYGADPEAKKMGQEGDIAGRMAKILIGASATVRR